MLVMTRYPRRVDALAAAIDVSPNLRDALLQLQMLPIVGQTDLVVDRATIGRGLDAFERGAISATTLQEWAEALHTAEDAELAPADRDVVARALFVLSTPELFGGTEDSVREVRALIDRSGSA